MFNPIVQWKEIPADADGDLTTGGGPRFRIGPMDRTHIDVLTDRLGLVQAYRTSP